MKVVSLQILTIYLYILFILNRGLKTLNSGNPEKFHHCIPTSFNKLPSLVYELLCHVIVTNELLETQTMQQPTPELKVGRDAEQHNHHREVDVKPVRDERNHVHVAHYLCEGKVKKT